MGLPPGVDQVVFEDLKKEYEAKNVVVFAGAGVSAGAGLPTWNQLAKALVERMRQTGKPKDALDEIEDFVGKGDLVNAMSAARASLQVEFLRELRRRLDDSGRDVPAVADAIAALAPQLAGVVTTNLDRLLERALGGAWPAIINPVADLLQRPRYIFKPHGTIDDASTWVFTREEYDQAMFGSQALQDLFTAIYRARTLLFVGASLTDDDFGLTLGRIRFLAGRNLPTHYAILPGAVLPMRRQKLEAAGIRLLVYENKSGTHHEVVDILKTLAGTASASGGASQFSGSASSPAATTLPTTASASSAIASTPSTPVPRGLARLVDLFLSAAPRDEPIRNRLIGHLKPLVDAKRIRITHAGAVLPGANKAATIASWVERAHLFVLLVSSDYLASDEQMAEATRAMARSATDGAAVLPVIVRACFWKYAVFGDLAAVPADGRPAAAFPDQDAALCEVVDAVRTILDQ